MFSQYLLILLRFFKATLASRISQTIIIFARFDNYKVGILGCVGKGKKTAPSVLDDDDCFANGKNCHKISTFWKATNCMPGY